MSDTMPVGAGTCQHMPMPKQKAPLEFVAHYSDADFRKIRAGHFEKNDNWFIYYDDPWLYFHRALTGTCVFQIRFAPGEKGWTAVESWVNHDPNNYTKSLNAQHRQLVTNVISLRLLDKKRTHKINEDNIALLIPAIGEEPKAYKKDVPEMPQEVNADTWKHFPMSETKAPLGFSGRYSGADFTKIRAGYFIKDMDEKWFIYYEEPWLYFHRSWTGICIYQIHFASDGEGWNAVESWAAHDPDNYTQEQNEHDKHLVGKLITSRLLNKEDFLLKFKRLS